MAKHRPTEIRRAILQHIFWNSTSPVPDVASQFEVTRQAVQRHMRELSESRRIIASGKTRYKRFRLAQLGHVTRTYTLREGFNEDQAWKDIVHPRAKELKWSSEETDICHYGVTEMVNNVIDHAEAKRVRVTLGLTEISVQLIVEDDGVGIFTKVAGALKLSDPHQALLELSKGKFTTDPRRHTGEGLFFTARLFDRFAIVSDTLRFMHVLNQDVWLTDDLRRRFRGTSVVLELLRPSVRSMQQVFAQFSSGPDDYRFAKTRVPLKLATFGDDSLISRSSARRVLARADRFDEVILDFVGVRTIGQAFADEIFRVFAAEHPGVELRVTNASPGVTAMIRRAQNAAESNR
jgi:anti-sigma regulatory factor (Ser/Thr protein kinase)